MPQRRLTPCAPIPSSRRLRQELDHDFERPPDKTLAFWSEMPLLYDQRSETEITYHACPMHAEIAASFAGTCPKCGMKLVAADPEAKTPMPFVCPMHAEITASWAAQCPLCGMTLRSGDAEPDETEHADRAAQAHRPRDDRMGRRHGRNQPSSQRDQHDLATHRPRHRTPRTPTSRGASPSATASRFVSSTRWAQTTRCHIPFHVHGAGRFIVLSRNGTPETNLVWKDTVLVFAGETVDILLDVTNPGLWMAHCHIAEHNQSRNDVQLRSRAQLILWRWRRTASNAPLRSSISPDSLH